MTDREKLMMWKQMAWHPDKIWSYIDRVRKEYDKADTVEEKKSIVKGLIVGITM